MQLRDRIYACFTGKNIGGTLGMPLEGSETRRDLTFYRPVPEMAVPNDDLELQLIWLEAFAQHGLALDAEKLGDYWLRSLDMHWDEYGVALANLRRGIKPPLSGLHNNNFTCGMGAAIRSEIWAALFAGQPATAAWFACCDASVDHSGDGVWAEIYLAAAQSALFEHPDLNAALATGLRFLPPESRVRQAVVAADRLHAAGTAPEAALDALMKEFGSCNFTDCVMNLAIIEYALRYGAGDFERTILLAANAGEDADCTAATVGAFLGILNGPDGIPARWSAKIGDAVVVSAGVRNLTPPPTIPALTDRILALRATLPAAGHPALPMPYRPELPLDFSENQPWLVNDRPVYFDGIRLDAAKFGEPEGKEIRLKTVLSFDSDQRVFVMVASRGLFLAWWDGENLMRKGDQMRPIPAPHRLRGGRIVPLEVRANQRYTLEIQLFPTWPVPDVYFGCFDWNNRHVDVTYHAPTI